MLSLKKAKYSDDVLSSHRVSYDDFWHLVHGKNEQEATELLARRFIYLSATKCFLCRVSKQQLSEQKLVRDVCFLADPMYCSKFGTVISARQYFEDNILNKLKKTVAIDQTYKPHCNQVSDPGNTFKPYYFHQYEPTVWPVDDNIHYQMIYDALGEEQANSFLNYLARKLRNPSERAGNLLFVTTDAAGSDNTRRQLCTIMKRLLQDDKANVDNYTRYFVSTSMYLRGNKNEDLVLAEERGNPPIFCFVDRFNMENTEIIQSTFDLCAREQSSFTDFVVTMDKNAYNEHQEAVSEGKFLVFELMNSKLEDAAIKSYPMQGYVDLFHYLLHEH